MTKKELEVALKLAIQKIIELSEENTRLKATKPPSLKVICYEMQELYPNETIEEWLVYAAAKYPSVNPGSLRVTFYRTDYKPPQS